MWQVTRLVGGDAEDRAEDLRADAGGGPSCGWRPTGASAAEVDPLQAQAIVEESVDCVMGAESAGCYDKEWFHEADSVPVDQACKGTSTRHPPRFREEDRFSRWMYEVPDAAGLTDETY